MTAAPRADEEWRFIRVAFAVVGRNSHDCSVVAAALHVPIIESSSQISCVPLQLSYTASVVSKLLPHRLTAATPSCDAV